MKGFYYIENYVNERDKEPTVYTETLEEAKEAIKGCSDWYCDNGTGKIYFQTTEFKTIETIEEPDYFLGETEPTKHIEVRQKNRKFVCRGKGLDENGNVIFSDKEW